MIKIKDLHKRFDDKDITLTKSKRKMGVQLKSNVKLIVISSIVFIVIMYVMLIYNLNQRTAYKIDYNMEEGYRVQYEDGFYYVTGPAHISVPEADLFVGKWVMDEELGEEIEVSLTTRKNIFGKQKMYITIYSSSDSVVTGYIYLDENFNHSFDDPDNVDYNRQLEEICKRHKELIEELIFKADIMWNIR